MLSRANVLGVGEENVCSTEPYIFETLSREALVTAFQTHPCCSKNCVSVICRLPASEQKCCAKCYPTGNEFCRSIPSAMLGDADDQRDYFNRIITATRNPWRKFEIQPDDTDEVKSEKTNLFDDELLRHFKQGQNVNGKYNWMECYYIYLPDGTKKKICKSAWIGITGITRGKLEYAQDRVKKGQEPIKAYIENDDAIDIEKAFEYWGMDYQSYRGHLQAYIDFDKVGETKGSIIAVAFLADFFDVIGEAQPDGADIHYDPVSYVEIYESYIADPFVNAAAQGKDIISLRSFSRIISEVFPNVRPREFKSVAGKCNVCEKIRSTMKTCTLRSDRIILKRYRLFHRNKFMGEKIKYYQRQQEAHESNGRVWSFIFDAMSKHRTRLPVLSNLAQMSNQFDNDVLGCIFHNGMRTQLYVSGPSVQLGASYMIHCLHEEIRRLLEDCKEPPPDKIYIQIDGASDNTAYVVFAAIEHLVAAGLCSTIEVWRLPVGHTHEDIDGRFGVISMHIRDQSIETPQKFFAEAKLAFRGDCEITYISAIYAYKEFYEEFLDKHLMVKKQDYTNLGFRYQRLTDDEKEDDRYSHLLDVKVNYKKVAQDITVDLRPMNPLYNESSESTNASCFYPVALLSYWQPERSFYDCDRLPGISFMTQRPHGTPKPLECAKWVEAERRFMGDMRKKYHLSSDKHIFESWESHYREHMPTVPNVEPPVPSDNIAHYMIKKGSDFAPPLGKYLYGPSPMSFEHLHRQTMPRSICISTEIESQPEYAFTEQYQSKATWIDDLIKSVVIQAHQTIPHKLNKDPFRRWEFDSPEIMQGVLVKVKVQKEDSDKFEMRLMPGRIVAFSDDDINHPPMFRVCLFNDEFPCKAKRYVDIVKETEYYDARFRYREKYPHEETSLDDHWDAKLANAKAREERRLQAEEKQRERERRQAQIQVDNQVKASEIQARREQKAREREEKAQEREEKARQKAEAKETKKQELLEKRRQAKEQKELQKRAAINARRKRTTNDAEDIEYDSGGESEAERMLNIVADGEGDEVANEGEDNDADEVSDELADVQDFDVDNGGIIVVNGEIKTEVSEDNTTEKDELGHENYAEPKGKEKTISIRGRRIIVAPNLEDEQLCECGCGLHYESSEMIKCRGGRRNVNPTDCIKIIGKVCCPNWECKDCEKPKEHRVEQNKKARSEVKVTKISIDESSTEVETEFVKHLSTSSGVTLEESVNEALERPNPMKLGQSHITSSRTSRTRLPRMGLSGEILCQCGCEALLNINETVECRGGTRLVNPTNCKKRIGRICCPSWTCHDCDR